MASIAICPLSACGSETDIFDPIPEPDENVIFQDEFNTFDFSVWSKEAHPAGWVNQELQEYAYQYVNIGVDGKKSVLILTAERKNGKIYSGRVNSKGKMSFKYGRIEASIRLPKTANGLWPAFWMMGDNSKPWPACGEIDIMEMGDATGISTNTSAQRVNTAIHFGESTDSHEQEYYAASALSSLQDNMYHTYAADWNENTIEISIDGNKFHTFNIKDNPYFHDNFYVLLNLAVGGSFTGITNPTEITGLGEGEKVSMYIDWIKIYKTK